MNFARAKTIMIFIFIFVNIFLLIVYNLFVLQDKKIDKETLITVLANNNITVDETLINDDRVTLNGVEVINSANDKETIAKEFLGKKYEKEKENTYKTDKARLTVANTSVELEIFSPSDRKYKDINELNAGNKVIKTISGYGIEKFALDVYNSSENANGDYHVTISYKYEDLPVFNHNLYAFASSKGLKNLKGSVISFNNVDDQEYIVNSVSEILLEFINNTDIKGGNEPVVITDVNLGYYIPVNEFEASIYAIPSYEIILESGKIYYYDARKEVDSSFRFLFKK